MEPLTSEEEIALAIRIRQGDRNALDELIARNMPFVRHVSKRFVNKGLDYDDLISEGTIGIIHAALDFEPVRYGTRFTTYAHFKVYEAMRSAVAQNVPMVRIPYWLYKLLTRLTKRGVDCTLTPTHEMAEAIGISFRKLKLVHRAACCLRFYDAEDPLEEIIIDPSTPPSEKHPALEASLDELDPFDAFILTLRYGLDDEKPMSLAEVGDYCGYSREQIRKRQRNALEELKRRLTA